MTLRWRYGKIAARSSGVAAGILNTILQIGLNARVYKLRRIRSFPRLAHRDGSTRNIRNVSWGHCQRKAADRLGRN